MRTSIFSGSLVPRLSLSLPLNFAHANIMHEKIEREGESGREPCFHLWPFPIAQSRMGGCGLYQALMNVAKTNHQSAAVWLEGMLPEGMLWEVLQRAN